MFRAVQFFPQSWSTLVENSFLACFLGKSFALSRDSSTNCDGPQDIKRACYTRAPRSTWKGEVHSASRTHILLVLVVLTHLPLLRKPDISVEQLHERSRQCENSGRKEKKYNGRVASGRQWKSQKRSGQNWKNTLKKRR